MDLIFATAGFAELSPAQQRQFELELFFWSLSPAIGYFLIAGAIWLFVNRRAVRNRQVSLGALLTLIMIFGPSLILLKLAAWPYWWVW